MEEKVAESHIIPCDDSRTRDWHAWINKMPPPPDDFHVVGEVLVQNPGVQPMLVPKEPQGINPKILMLNLFLHQKPGVWPRVLVWKPVAYKKVTKTDFSHAEIYCGDRVIAEIEVKEVH